MKLLNHRLRLAAAQCGMPMAFRSASPSLFFPEAQPQEKEVKTSPGKAQPFRTVLRQSRDSDQAP